MGLLLFESSLVATILLGEPVISIFCLIGAQLALTRVLDDNIFFIFLGALCATLFAKQLEWKTKTDQISHNIGEALLVLIPTTILFPFFIPPFVRLLGSCVLYFIVLQNWQIPLLIIFVNLFEKAGDPLAFITIITCILSVFFYITNKIRWDRVFFLIK
jgi:hypothetical protein